MQEEDNPNMKGDEPGLQNENEPPMDEGEEIEAAEDMEEMSAQHMQQ